MSGKRANDPGASDGSAQPSAAQPARTTAAGTQSPGTRPPDAGTPAPAPSAADPSAAEPPAADPPAMTKRTGSGSRKPGSPPGGPAAGQSSARPAPSGGLPPTPAKAAEGGLLAINARYFALRLLIFFAVLAVFLVPHITGPLLGFFLSLVISGLVSYPLAVRQRRAVIAAMEQRRGWLR